LYVDTPLREFVKQYPVGVYLWTNKSTSQQYVGSSKVLEERLLESFNMRSADIPGGNIRTSPPSLAKQRGGGDTRIFNAIKENGVEGFVLCVIGMPGAIQTDALALEQYILDHYVMYYNMNRRADTIKGYIHPPEMRE